MEFISLKKRSTAEIKEILNAAAQGVAFPEICSRFDLSETSLYRILGSRSGYSPPKKKSSQQTIDGLKKKLAERDREIALLRAALKKS